RPGRGRPRGERGPLTQPRGSCKGRALRRTDDRDVVLATLRVWLLYHWGSGSHTYPSFSAVLACAAAQSPQGRATPAPRTLVMQLTCISTRYPSPEPGMCIAPPPRPRSRCVIDPQSDKPRASGRRIATAAHGSVLGGSSLHDRVMEWISPPSVRVGGRIERCSHGSRARA